MSQVRTYDPTEGEFVDFETLDDWREQFMVTAQRTTKEGQD